MRLHTLIHSITTASVLFADDQVDLRTIRDRAENGDVAAQVALAVRLRDGKGVEKDDAAAMQWAHRAADAGNADAMDFVGFAYLRGAVVKRNPGIAFGYFKAAAEKSAQAAFNLGQCYYGAQGTEQDCAKAIEWWKKAAARGHGRAASTAAMALLSDNCGSTACATFARFHGGKIGGWDFKKLCPSPLGTGTDWWHLLDASAKIGQQWKLVTYTPDDAGFEQAAAMLKTELDADRPVVADFKYLGPQYPGGFAGHTLSVCGYIAAEHLYILCNPAVATPGLQLITSDDLKNFWRSDYYGARANAVLSRPAFVIEKL